MHRKVEVKEKVEVRNSKRGLRQGLAGDIDGNAWAGRIAAAVLVVVLGILSDRSGMLDNGIFVTQRWKQ